MNMSSRHKRCYEERRHVSVKLKHSVTVVCHCVIISLCCILHNCGTEILRRLYSSHSSVTTDILVLQSYKKTLNILRKCEVSDFYRLLNCYIAAWEIAECNEKWHAQCKIFSWFVRWYITFLHCRYFIWILHCPFHKVLLFSNVNVVNNVQCVADLHLQY